MGMIPNPTSTTLIIALSGVSTIIFIMLLPALVELKRPKDAGPRMIMDDVPTFRRLQLKGIIQLPSIEEETLGLDQSISKKIADIIAVLPNLDV
jgi:hypothetical protein